MTYKAVRGQACAGSAAVPASWQISKGGDLRPPQPPLHFKWEALGAPAEASKLERAIYTVDNAFGKLQREARCG